MKMLVSDYDKTFYLNDDDIEINKKCIDTFRENGNIFVIATGRSYLDFKKASNSHGLKYDYVILNHGATIIDNKDNILYNEYMEDGIARKIKDFLRLDKTISNFCCSLLESRVDFNHKEITKINAKYSTLEDALDVYKKILNTYSTRINIYHVSTYTVEIVSNKVNKAEGISFLANKLNLNKDFIYTIGDSYSDIEMIKNYNGYCMSDSKEDVKKVAIEEVDSVSKLIKSLLKTK